MTSKKIGFIGTGVMGKHMAGHLMAAGNKLVIHSRTKEKASGLLEKGASWAETPADVATQCSIIFTIVGYPQDVKDVYFGKDGIFTALKSGSYLIDMTTSSPELAVKLHDFAAESKSYSLDAPVSGGDTGATNGTLSIMVGGYKPAFDDILPLFEIMGQNIVYQGPAGSGQHCKMCNQITIASTMIGVCEAISYASKAGLDPETVLKSISAGAAGSWSLSNLAPRILNGDFDPGFYIKHFIKDMEIAATSSKNLDIDTPGLNMALQMYKALAQAGFEDEGTQALYRLYG